MECVVFNVFPGEMESKDRAAIARHGIEREREKKKKKKRRRKEERRLLGSGAAQLLVQCRKLDPDLNELDARLCSNCNNRYSGASLLEDPRRRRDGSNAVVMAARWTFYTKVSHHRQIFSPPHFIMSRHIFILCLVSLCVPASEF